MAKSALFGQEYKHERYRCQACGLQAPGRTFGGRPQPGFCSARGKDSRGNMKPHIWIKES